MELDVKVTVVVTVTVVEGTLLVEVDVEVEVDVDVLVLVLVDVDVDVVVEREHVDGIGGAKPQTARPGAIGKQEDPGAHCTNLPLGQLTIPEKPVEGSAQYVPADFPAQNVSAKMTDSQL